MTTRDTAIAALDAHANQVADDRTATLEEALDTQQGLTRAALDRAATAEAELDECRDQHDPADPAMWIGAANNMPSGLPKDNGWWAPDGPKAKAAFKAVAARGRTA